jgi:hypothetical protein
MVKPKCAVTHSISLCQLLHSPLHEMAEPDGEHTTTTSFYYIPNSCLFLPVSKFDTITMYK